MISRFQVDSVFLAETQINLALLPCTFSIRNKLFKDKESVAILSHDKQEQTSVRKQGGVLQELLAQQCAL